jgi:hypothetical protein
MKNHSGKIEVSVSMDDGLFAMPVSGGALNLP